MSRFDLLQAEAGKERGEDAVKTNEERSQSDDETVDEVAESNNESWKLDLEKWLKSNVGGVQVESAENGGDGRVELADEGEEQVGEDDWVAVELAEDILGEVGEGGASRALASLEAALLHGGHLGVGGLDGLVDLVDVGDHGLGGSVLLLLAGVGWNRVRGGLHGGGWGLDLVGEVDEHAGKAGGVGALLNGHVVGGGGGRGREQRKGWDGEKRSELHFDGV